MPEPMAIVGMGCRWAGGVRDTTGLWEFLINKRSGYRDWAEPRFSTKGFYHPNPERPGTTAAKGGYVVTEDPRLFDPSFFGISGLEAETIDPSQRKLLEVVYEALESAGETWESINGTRTGVYVADISYDNSYAQTRDWEYARPHATTGVCHNILSNRINYVFNLTGPSVTLDSACTSALYGLHMAIQAIRDGDCDSAIVATANYIMDPSMQIAMDKLGALSATSMSHAFDASADGYARGEGFAAIYLKRPDKAMQDGSPIRALVRGSAIGANGRSSGITHPSGIAQEAIIRKAYENAGHLPPSETPFLECHGTGTRVGDPLEVEAAGKVFGPGRSSAEEDRLLIGSIKTSLGHTEGAAALAGIFKAVLALEAGIIPPSVGVKTLNPRIDFDKAKAKVVTEVTPWPTGKLRRASVTSAGFGGSIGHCILDHVNVYYPDYVKPGIFGSKIHSLPDLPTDTNLHNGTNGSINNGTKSNGHPKGHVNGSRHVYNGVLEHNGNGIESNGVISHGHDLDEKNSNESTSDGTQDSKVHDSPNNGYQNGSSTITHRPITEPPQTIKKADADTRELVILPFAANNEPSLKANIERLSKVIDSHSLADVAYTLGARRSKLTQRTFRVIEKGNVAQSLFNDTQKTFTSPQQVPRLAFIFTGQGAQWHGMGAQLFDYRIFRTAIQYLDRVLALLPDAPSWMISDILNGDYDADRIQAPEVSQTVCTAVQIGLIDLLASWSIRPSGVVGHSSGEMAAAYAAGRITAAESITAAFYRGQAVALNKQKGGMLAVSLTVEQATDYLLGLEQEIKIAAINSPGSLTLSGELGSIERLSATLTEKGTFNRLLKTGGNAYHSHHMVRLGESYDTILSNGLASLQKHQNASTGGHHRYAAVPWVSSVTPNKPLPLENIPASYWRLNLESPVRFSEAVANLVQRKDLNIGALVEIGPHPALRSPLDQILKSIGEHLPYASSLKRGEDSRRSVLQLAGTLFGLNAEVNFTAVNATDEAGGALGHGVLATDLPPYQFTYGPIAYYESRASKEYRLRSVPRHDLIGSKIAGNAKLRPQFRNVLRMKDLPWLGDHRLLPDVVFPAAGYLCMAMVAATQLHEENQDALPVVAHSLRNINIKTALKIPEDQHGIEIILSMELSDNSSAQKPAWISFSVSSVARDSDQWTEHCTGTVKVEVSDSTLLTRSERIDTNIESRIADTRNWYKTFAAIGLGYGPTFQALSDIRADPVKNIAIARLGLKTTSGVVKGGESSYPIHPASLDAMIQLGLLASHGGQTDRTTTAYVPIHLSQMRLQSGLDQEWNTAVAHGEFRGLRSAYLQLQLQSETGDLLLDIKDLRCISYNLESQSASRRSNNFASPFTRMVYKPDFRTLSNRQARALFPAPDENLTHVAHLEDLQTIASLAALEIDETFLKNREDFLSLPQNIADYLTLIQRIADKSRQDSSNKTYSLALTDRQQFLQDLYRKRGHLIEVQAIERLHRNFMHITKQEKTGEEILAEDGLLGDFFVNSLFLTGPQPQIANVLDSLSHANPNLKFLEMRGGDGNTARTVIKALNGSNGIKRYQSYTVTDVYEKSLHPARSQLEDFKDIIFSVLDFAEDPLEQGYQPVYDVVLASQAIHTASSITKTLENGRRLLKPGGKLILIETTGNSDWVKLIGGAQAGYWHGVSDGRIDSPFLDVTQWHAALRLTGFSGVDLALDDYPRPVTQSSVIVSTRVEHHVKNGIIEDQTDPPVVYLLHSGTGVPPLLKRLAQEIEHRGLETKTFVIDDAPQQLPQGATARVIAFLDDNNLLLNVDQPRLEVFQYLAHNTHSMVWLTSTGMAQGRDPTGAVVGGLLRTISTEAPTGRFFSVDIDADHFNLDGYQEAEDFVHVLADQEQALQQPNDGEASEDREFAWHNGVMWVARLVPEPTLQGYAESFSTPATHGAELLPIDSQEPVRAAFETAGILSSFYFLPYTELRRQPLPKDWIELKVSAVGLNWKDLLLATGRFDGNNLSSEYAGIVTQVGPEAASRFSVGDHVYGLGKGHFGNFTRVPAALAQKARPSDDLVHMATLPVVFMTAVYAFEYLTRLRPGQKVLIQSASGGVGLGAIQLARTKGAEVFAMAGTPEKREFLVNSIGIARSNVLSNHDLTDLARAIDSTQDGGFDVILSTAHGDMLYETIKAVAPLGHLIDIGRMDVDEAKVVSLELFQKSATFSSFDLARVVERDPGLGAKLMSSVGDHYRAGRIGPIQPLTTSDISQLDQTLLAFSKGRHVGKFVVSFQNPDSRVKMVRSPSAAHFDPEACYVITGGLSGLGRSIIQWMGSRGARELVVLSRRGGSAPEAQSLVNALAERGIAIRPVACDLSSQGQVIKAINDAGAIKPVKGIVHCAVSYQDISFDKITAQGWRDGLAAKVQGTQNLHEATKNLQLDFFVMTTSILSVLSFATQGAYTAANNFQDYFARYRRRLGLPATAAQFGLVNDVGHLSTDTTTLDLMARNKVMTLPESYFLRLLEPAFVNHNVRITHDALAAATYVTYMDPAHMAEKEQEYAELGIRSATAPRWYGDARVSHVIRGFEDGLRHDTSDEGAGGDVGKSPTAKLRQEFEEIKKRVHDTPTGPAKVEQRAQALEMATAAIADTVAAMLLLDQSAVSTSRAVSDHGVDSLIAAELRNWFYVALGSKISMVDLLDPRTSIAALAAKIIDAEV